MFFSTAYSSAGQFLNDGSTIFTRRSVAGPSATTQCQTGPRQASTTPNAWPPAGRGGRATRVGPSGVRPAAARISRAPPRASPRRTLLRPPTSPPPQTPTPPPTPPPAPHRASPPHSPSPPPPPPP